ncbi:pre-toxin TG domain-containing protein [Saccharopolyspora hirsuta]|nr:ribonuclease domain-containing protein [Saccharopolyspora hirsuta]
MPDHNSGAFHSAEEERPHRAGTTRLIAFVTACLMLFTTFGATSAAATGSASDLRVSGSISDAIKRIREARNKTGVLIVVGYSAYQVLHTLGQELPEHSRSRTNLIGELSEGLPGLTEGLRSRLDRIEKTPSDDAEAMESARQELRSFLEHKFKDHPELKSLFEQSQQRFDDLREHVVVAKIVAETNADVLPAIVEDLKEIARVLKEPLDFDIDVAALERNNRELAETLEDVQPALDQCNAAMQQTIAALDQMNAAMGQVNAGLDQMNSGIAQLNRGIDQANDAVAEMNVALEQTNNAVNGMIGAATDTFRNLGNLRLDDLSIDLSHLGGSMHRQTTPEERARQDRMLSIGLNLIPGLGDVKGIHEAIAGRDALTGELLPPAERVMGGIIFLRSAKVLSKGATSATDAARLRGTYRAWEAANESIRSLRTTGKLPGYYVTKAEAKQAGWTDGKALGNHLPNAQIGGDVFKNKDGVLPSVSGRVWYEADVGLVNTMSRSKQPGYRLVYSSDGLLYVTFDHYHSVHYVGRYK